MYPDRDNLVYYDTEKCQFYIIKWEDGGNNDIPHRYYIDTPYANIYTLDKVICKGKME